MVEPEPVRATVFEYSDSGFRGPNKELWREIAENLAEAFPDAYRFEARYPMSLLLQNTIRKCPSHSSLILLRRLEARIVRLRQHHVLIELSLGNCFTTDGRTCEFTANHCSRDSATARWIRNQARIPCKEHVDRIRRFILDAEECGWYLPHVELEPVPTDEIELVNNAGRHIWAPQLTRRLWQAPLIPPRGRRLAAVTEDIRTAAEVGQRIHQQLQRLSPQNSVYRPSPINLPRMSDLPEGVLGLIVIPDHLDLAGSPEWLAYLADLERRRQRFKLIRASTVSNRHALATLCHDLLLRDDACPWVGSYRSITDVVAVDAGHAREDDQSLWISTAYALEDNRLDMRCRFSPRHEDLPSELIEDIRNLRGGRDITFIRDGRFHKHEVRALQEESEIPTHRMFEIIKNPGAILFRGELENPRPAVFGDCLRYDAKTLLLQTIEPDAKDYGRPIRVRAQAPINADLATDILTLCKQPTLSYYHDARLPAPVYWADRASKRNVQEWAKIIGRGWGLPKI